jgi:hypothetical protein
VAAKAIVMRGLDTPPGGLLENRVQVRVHERFDACILGSIGSELTHTRRLLCALGALDNVVGSIPFSSCPSSAAGLQILRRHPIQFNGICGFARVADRHGVCAALANAAP